MRLITPLKPADFARVAAPPLLPSTPVTNPETHLPSGTNYLPIYIGLGLLTVTIAIVLSVIVIKQQSEVTNQLSQLSLELKKNPYLLNPKITNHANTEQPTA
jgi:hypothetical protein